MCLFFSVFADHNGRLEPKQGQQNGVSAAPLPARRSLGAGLRPSPQPQAPSPQEVAAELRKRLLPDLRHNAAAFEAMAVLLDYTTTKVRCLPRSHARRYRARARRRGALASRDGIG